jgi:predicted RNA binding protein YcfA (HicA-like mRNA interferase family)
MPRKLRELRAELRRNGFSLDHQTGSHQVWKHPLIPGISANLAGKDGDDAKTTLSGMRYQEQEVREALRKLQQAKKGQQP